MSQRHQGARVRLDVALVRSGLASTRERARALILAGRARVDGQLMDKPGREIPSGASVELTPGRRPFASRGGEKLDGVLEPLAVDPSGLRCIDVGASTGGFTDVLLRRGASHVTALDVGRGLIDDRLRRDERVHVVERVNARYLEAGIVRPPYDLATIDVSFISLTLVLPAILPLVPAGRVLALVKPQFEAGRENVGSGGVVRDDAVRLSVVSRVARFLIAEEFGILGVRASPLAGPKGNREVFLLAGRAAGMPAATLDAQLAREVNRGRN